MFDFTVKPEMASGFTVGRDGVDNITPTLKFQLCYFIPNLTHSQDTPRIVDRVHQFVGFPSPVVEALI